MYLVLFQLLPILALYLEKLTTRSQSLIGVISAMSRTIATKIVVYPGIRLKMMKQLKENVVTAVVMNLVSFCLCLQRGDDLLFPTQTQIKNTWLAIQIKL